MEETQIPLQVSVLIVSYNRAAALRRCLAALEQSAERERFEIIVVDNGSQDESTSVIAEFPTVTPLHLPRNFGFTRALNIAMRTAKAEFFFFLNSRTEVLPDTVTRLTACLAADERAVAVCPVLETSDGTPVTPLYKIPSAAKIGAVASAEAYERAPAPEAGEDVVPVDLAGFTALMVRGYFLKGLRYIDERYAQCWADAEIGTQIRRSSRKTLLARTVRAVLHQEDELWASMPAAARTLITADWMLGAAAFAGKHFGFMAGLKLRIATTLSALFSFRIRLFRYLASGQKIDGTQSVL